MIDPDKTAARFAELIRSHEGSVICEANREDVKLLAWLLQSALDEIEELRQEMQLLVNDTGRLQIKQDTLERLFKYEADRKKSGS